MIIMLIKKSGIIFLTVLLILLLSIGTIYATDINNSNKTSPEISTSDNHTQIHTTLNQTTTNSFKKLCKEENQVKIDSSNNEDNIKYPLSLNKTNKKIEKNQLINNTQIKCYRSKNNKLDTKKVAVVKSNQTLNYSVSTTNYTVTPIDQFNKTINKSNIAYLNNKNITVYDKIDNNINLNSSLDNYTKVIAEYSGVSSNSTYINQLSRINSNNIININSLKKSSITEINTNNQVIVQSYGNLVTEINNLKSDTNDYLNYTIDLDPTVGIYYITENITWGNCNSQLKNLTINGNGAIIDGNGLQTFIIIETGYTLNLINVTIQNTTKNTDDKFYGGGAINNNGTLIVTECTFLNNTCNYGGAIVNTGVLNVTDSTFEYGSALFGGGIFNYLSNATIINTTFSNITLSSKGTGGGIYSQDGYLIVKDSRFINNTAYYGAAIRTISDTELINSTFEYNNNSYGGSIFAQKYNFNVTNCILMYNYGGETGSSLVNYAGSCIVKNSTFKYNTGKTSTVTNLYGNSFSIYNSTLNNNKGGYGAALYNIGSNFIVDNCTIENNNATTSGGGIYNTNFDATVKNTIMNNNTAWYGGAIYNDHYINIINSTFNSNNASTGCGGAVVNVNGNSVIENSTFTNNVAYSGGVIANQPSEQTVINNCKFINNSAFEGGVISSFPYSLTQYYTNLTVKNSLFINDSAISTTNKALGGAIYSSNGTNTTLINNTFNNIKSNNETLNILGNNTFENNIYTNCTINISINTDNTNVTVFDSASITIILEHPKYYDSDILENMYYTVYVNDKTYTTTSGMIYTITPTNNQTLVTYIKLNEDSLGNSNSLTLNVNKINTTTYVDSIYESNIITVYVTDNNGQAVTDGLIYYYDNDNNLLGTSTITPDGSSVYKVPYTIKGTYPITVTYNGTDSYNKSTNTTIVQITTTESKLSLEVLPATTTTNTIIKVNVTDENDKTITTGTIKIYSNDNIIYEQSISSDEPIIISHIFNIAGDYPITAVYTDSSTQYYSSTNSTDITIPTTDTTLTINAIAKNTTESGQITISVRDINNNIITSGNVVIYVNNIKIDERSLGTDGTITDSYLFSTSGTNRINAVYYDNSGRYTSDSQVTTITISSTDVIINVDVIPKTTTVNTGFNIEVLDVNNNTVQKGTLELIIDGNTIKTATINSTKTLINSLITKPGQHNITIKYEDNTGIYSEATKNTVVNINSTNVELIPSFELGTTTTRTHITVHVIDENGFNLKTGNVSLYDNENKLLTTSAVRDGFAYIDYYFETSGDQYITLTYTNNNNSYKNSSIQSNIYIYKTKTYINVLPVNMEIYKTTILRAEIYDKNYMILYRGTVDYYINGTFIGTSWEGDPMKAFMFYCNIYPGVYNLTAVYKGSDTYESSSSTTTITIKGKVETTVKVQPVTATCGDTVLLTATVTDTEGNIITGGKVVFKVNGITVKDSDGNPLYSEVVNGLATVNYTSLASWVKSDSKITTIYSGTSIYYSGNDQASVNISKRNATITLNTTSKVTSGDTIQLTSIIKDTNGTLINSGKVVFKFNGKTIKDAGGNAILVDVVNGVAKLNYTLPDGTSARNYTYTAVYSDKGYNRVETNTTQEVVKIATNFKLNTITLKDSSIIINATYKDEHDHYVVGTSKIAIKINDITLLNNTGGNIFYITNGTINLKILTGYINKYQNKKVEIITGDKSAYLGTRKVIYI